MIRFFSTAIIVFFIVSQTFAVERGKVGISLESSYFGYLNYNSSGSSIPFASVGLRFSPSDFLDFDLSYGFLMTSEVKKDSASNTRPEAAGMSHVFSIGAVINPVTAGNAIFGIYGRFSGIVNKNNVQVYPSYSYSYPLYIDYMDFTPLIGFGVEPSYYFSKNFSIYFRTGVAIEFAPAAKYAELKTGGNGDRKSDYNLKDEKNEKTTIGTDGIALGLRFLFGK